MLACLILRVASERRYAQNERDGAGLRSSVAAATPSQLRRSSAARTMSGRRGSRKSLSTARWENLPPFAFGQKQGYLCFTLVHTFALYTSYIGKPEEKHVYTSKQTIQPPKVKRKNGGGALGTPP